MDSTIFGGRDNTVPTAERHDGCKSGSEAKVRMNNGKLSDEGERAQLVGDVEEQESIAASADQEQALLAGCTRWST